MSKPPPTPPSPAEHRPWFSTHGITIHRALRDEEAHHPPYPSEAGRHHALTVFLDWHDFHRPHTGIDGQTRASHVTNLSGQHT
nr:hypothetical protein GCM10020241_57590 [Streptoalloteichus tenebrarius]